MNERRPDRAIAQQKGLFMLLREETFELEAQWERDGDELLVTVMLDDKETVVRVAPVGVATGNGCPSEQEYRTAVEDAAWEREVGCLACGSEAGELGEQVYDDHTCTVYEVSFPRPYPTEFPLPLVVGRPAWVRTEFTAHAAGERLVGLLDSGEVNDGYEPNPHIDTFPTEWDVSIEWVDTALDEWKRLRHPAGETSDRIAGYLMARVAAE
jgi:hypothetical protein